MSKKNTEIARQRKPLHKRLWDKREVTPEGKENPDVVPWDAISQNRESKKPSPEDEASPTK